MKYILLSIIGLIIWSSCTVQDSEKSLVFENHKTYYEIIDRAELDIVDANYESALSHYKKAFKSIPQPFSRDIYNAAIVASLLGDEEFAKDQVKALLALGLSHDYIRAVKHFKPLVDKYPDFFASAKPKTLNEELSTRLWEMREKDQFFRRYDNAYKIYNDTIKAIDQENIRELLQIFKENNYPKEGIVRPVRIGIMWDLPQDLIITHALQNGDTSLVGDLNIALKKGLIHPLKYSIFMGYLEETFVGQYAPISFYKRNSTIQKEYTPAQEDSLNIRRAEIGLESLEDYNRKALYMQFANQEEFILGVRYTHWFIEDMPPMPAD